VTESAACSRLIRAVCDVRKPPEPKSSVLREVRGTAQTDHQDFQPSEWSNHPSTGLQVRRDNLDSRNGVGQDLPAQHGVSPERAAPPPVDRLGGQINRGRGTGRPASQLLIGNFLEPTPALGTPGRATHDRQNDP
jgi:hypothetical protein